jgi:hypothetical protein
MPSIKDLWPDRWLKAAHLAGKRARVVIARVDLEAIFNPRTRQPEPRLVATFHAKTLRLVLNKTQSHALAAICNSDDYTRWTGHEVVLSVAKAPNGMDTILISPIPDPPTPASGAAVPAPTAPVAEDDDDDDEHIDMDPDTGIDDNPFDH